MGWIEVETVEYRRIAFGQRLAHFEKWKISMKGTMQEQVVDHLWNWQHRSNGSQVDHVVRIANRHRGDLLSPPSIHNTVTCAACRQISLVC